MAADTCELRATRQKVKASAICFVLPSRLPLELGGEGSADICPLQTVETVEPFQEGQQEFNAAICSQRQQDFRQGW